MQLKIIEKIAKRPAIMVKEVKNTSLMSEGVVEDLNSHAH